MMIQIGLLTLLCLLNIEYGFCACKSGAKPCDWEPWQQWGSCSRTCGAGFRTRSRKLCCGDNLPDCAGNCHRGDNSQETEMCSNSCPNGGTVVDGICQCPPLKYGMCCEYAESKTGTSCARHCTWINWRSWGDCSTDCGCGTKVRERSLCCSTKLIGNGTQCDDDCQMEGKKTNVRTCTQACRQNSLNGSCTLCSWNAWDEWSTCSKKCEGGQRSRSRSPCCCKGQDPNDCLSDCGLSDNSTIQFESCNSICFNGGQFSNSKCICSTDFTGSCCADEVTEGNCSKCSWNPWEVWMVDNGQISRTRRLCCREGQRFEDCMKECSMNRHTDSQSITCSGKGEGSDIIYITGGVASLVSVVLTSLVWIGYHCCRQRMRGSSSKVRTDVSVQKQSTTPHGYIVPEGEDGCEHIYDEAETGRHCASYHSQNEYVNVTFCKQNHL